ALASGPAAGPAARHGRWPATAAGTAPRERPGEALGPAAGPPPSPRGALAAAGDDRKESVVIRFRCPLCGQTLKASEENPGKPANCPRGGGRCVVPAGAAALEAGGDAGPADPSRGEAPDGAPPGLFAGMSRRVRWAAALLALAVPLGLLLAVLRP